jgi:cephalosporin-C deacetylase-like acetyl esterase
MWMRYGCVLAGLLFGGAAACAGDAQTPGQAGRRPDRVGPWDLEHLRTVPQYTWGEAAGSVREIYYENEPYQGRPTRVFAYYVCPSQGEGPFPAMVLVHGGGGTAFAEWASLWAERGYAALAMDLAGCGPDRQPLPDGGPGQGHEFKFREFSDNTVGDMWTYHAVAAEVRGHSLLASFAEVDANRIGVTGISWGGYLTCILAGVDDRLRVAVPVYGCGFLHENSAWIPIFDKMTPELRDRWVQYFDPSQYLPLVRCPLLMINGTNDFAYPLDSYRKSYRAVPGNKQLCVTVRMPHSHPAGWAPQEIGLFVDSVLRQGLPLPKIGALACGGEHARAEFESQAPVVQAQLHYTTDQGPWQERQWQTESVQVTGPAVTAPLPAARPLVCFVTLRDERGAVVSSEHVVLESPSGNAEP